MAGRREEASQDHPPTGCVRGDFFGGGSSEGEVRAGLGRVRGSWRVA